LTPPVQDPEHPPQKFNTYKNASMNGENDSDRRSDVPVVVMEEIEVSSAICMLSKIDAFEDDIIYIEKIAVLNITTDA
jgi:hypothetical protein